MGTSASKAKVSPDASNSDGDGVLANERPEDIKNTVSDAARELAQRSPPLLPEHPTTRSLADMQEASPTSNKIVAPDAAVDSNEKRSLNLPERLKLSPPSTPAVSLNTHKRFRSEEPEEQAASSNERDKEPSGPTIERFTIMAASDESDGAPEVVSVVSRKSTDRLAKGRKRRRLEEDISGGLESPKIDQATATSASEKEKFPKQTPSNNANSDIKHPRHDLTGGPPAPEQSNEPVGQKLINGENLGSGVPESNSNSSAMIQTKMDEKDITSEANLAPGDDAGANILSSDMIPSPSGKDATLDPVIAETGFKVPFFEKHEAKVSELNAESVNKLNTSALDDAESGSHTEAGSATLTNNSFVTVPENQPFAHGETYSDAKDQNLTETDTLPLTQQSSPDHPAVRQGRPWKAMPQPVQNATSLQDFRRRMLDRNPRTNVWGPPGFRKTRFVGA